MGSALVDTLAGATLHAGRTHRARDYSMRMRSLGDARRRDSADEQDLAVPGQHEALDVFVW